MNPTKSLPRSLADWFAVLLAAFLSTDAAAQIHQLKEMNTEQLRALPRDKTVVLMPGAYIGEHGPYLPCFVDGFRNAWLAQELAEAIVERPGWHVLIFPFIPIGQGGANEIGERHWFSGTFVVRTATLRAVFMDLAEDLGAQGFRWVFLMSNHGSPDHVQALDQAGDYFHETYGRHMVNLGGLVGLDQLDEIVNGLKSEAERAEDGFTVHAGMSETSEALFLRPDLVSPAYKQAPALTGRSFDDLIAFAKKDDWPGYFGSPRLGSAAVGARALKEYSARLNKLALEILGGRDYRAMPRYADEMLKTIPADNATVQHEQAVGRKQSDWLKRKTGAADGGQVPSTQRLEANKELLRRAHAEVWSQGNMAAVDELYALDFICHFIAGIEWKGADGLKAEVKRHRAAFPDWHEQIEQVVAEGEFVMTRFTSTGTHRDDFNGLPATGKTVKISELAVHRIANGKIAEQWEFPDAPSLEQQLGAATPGAESKRIIRRYFEEWANRGDTAVADELIATNLVLRNPPSAVLAAGRKQFEEESIKVVTMHDEWARGLMAQGRYDEAEPHWQMVVEIRKKHKNTHGRRFSAESRLGECLFKQGKQLDRAETLLDQGYQELEKRRLQLPDEVRLEILGSALVRLAEFYEGTGRPAQAAEFKRKLADLEKFEGRRLLTLDFLAPQ